MKIISTEALPLLSEEEWSAVEEGFRQALARDYPGALDGLAGFYAKLDRFSDQGALYEEAALKEADTAKKSELLMNAGLAYLKAGEQRAGSAEQGATRNASNANNVSGEELGVRRGDANNAERNNATNAKNAERLFRSAIAVNPTDPKPYQQLVTAIYAARKDLAGAKEIISQGIKNGAPPLSLYLSLAEAAQKGSSPEETKAALDSAKAEVEKLVKNGESPYTLYIALADGSRRAGDREQETGALLKALDLQPRSPDVLSRLATLYFEKQNYDRAALYLNRIANINPDSANIYYSLALAEEGRYRFVDAGRAYARAVELEPDNKDFLSRYAEFKARVAANTKPIQESR